MKTFLVLCMTVLAVLSTSLQADVKNADKPLKGNWDFKIKPVWTIETAGEEVFAGPRKILVSDDGTVYVYDRKNMEFYIFSKEGKYIKTFGTRGEGPGEIKRFYNAQLIGDTLAVVDAFELEFYDKNGKSIKSVKNDYTKRLPDYFLNENEFIFFPLVITPVDDLKEEISHFNLETQKQTPIAKFPVFKGGFTESENRERIVVMILPPLTPIVAVGYDTDRFYYGLNKYYEINVVDYKGKKLDGFSLDRPIKKVSKEERRTFVKNGPLPLPAEMVDQIAKSLPEQLTFYTRMAVHNKLLYVYVSYLSNSLPVQQVDIFSPEGKYLYRGEIKPEEGYGIFVATHAMIYIKDNFLYMAQEKEDGEIVITKSQIELPTL